MRRSAVLTCVLAVAALMVVRPAGAQSGADDWEFTIAPYMLAAAMDGTVGIGERQLAVDAPFSDILDKLEIGGMVYLAMQNDRWLLSSQAVFMDLEQSHGMANGTGTASAEETIVEVAAGYRATESFTLLVGARWVDLETALGFEGTVFDGDFEADESWIDPFVGVSFTAPLSGRWVLDLRGDLGGFGVGSDLTWQAWANVGFRASRGVSLFLGYHALDIDYDDDGGARAFRYDVLTSGPQLGVAFHF